MLVLGGLGAYLFDQRTHWIEHYALRPLPMLGIALLAMAALGLRASANQTLFGELRVRARWGDWFALVTVNSFSNYLPLSAGLVAKAFYLKRVHSMPYTEFAVGQGALLLLVIATNGMVGLATVLLFGSTGVGVCTYRAINFLHRFFDAGQITHYVLSARDLNLTWATLSFQASPFGLFLLLAGFLSLASSFAL